MAGSAPPHAGGNGGEGQALAAQKAKRDEGELKSTVISAFDKAGTVNASRDYVHVLRIVQRAEDGSFHTIKKVVFGGARWARRGLCSSSSSGFVIYGAPPSSVTVG